MKIRRIAVRQETFELTRPYAIAFRSADTAYNVIVDIETDDGRRGLGACSPEPHVTGEDLATCLAALEARAREWSHGRTVEELLAEEPLTRAFPGAPAARAALEMALYDLAAQKQGVPLARLLGQCHRELPTSITIGIKSLDETIQEADEYLGRGFRILKLKLGEGLAIDLPRLARLSEHVAGRAKIRVDMNQAYSPADLVAFVERSRAWPFEFIEQPLPAAAKPGASRHAAREDYRRLPAPVRELVALDESLLTPEDAVALCEPVPAGKIFNIKLMKCGGIGPARAIARVAEKHGLELMWGCMDESCVSIAAALHAAFSCPATRYLDLDGSLDLARDVATGGFVLEQGLMRLTDEPGLGVRPI